MSLRLPNVIHHGLIHLLLFPALGLVGGVQTAMADDWPQWRGPQRDGVWRETGIVDKFGSKELTPKWSVPISSGYSGPSVSDGRVFVTDRVREPEQIERVLCFDEETGKSLWTFEYPCVYTISYEAGPRASVLIDDDRAYALGAMGHFHCLNAETGDVIWSRDLAADYGIDQKRMPIWGIAAAPLLVEDRLIVQTGGADACVLCVDKMTGKELWTSLNDRDCYSAPILVEQGGQQVAIVWTGDSVAGLSPEDGTIFWQVPWPPRNMPIGIATPIVQGQQVFLTSFYDGALMIRLGKDGPTAEVDWKRVGSSELDTDGLQSIISTPLFLNGYLYGCDSHGELRCLDPKTGDRLWEDLTATPRARWSNIHFIRHEQQVWMFNERGELLITELSPDGLREIDRTKIIEPTLEQLRRRGGVCWAHPAFANRHVFIRNDEELRCISLAKSDASE